MAIMKLYRLCKEKEIKTILKDKNFDNVGIDCSKLILPNTHKYKHGKKYLHFFDRKENLLYLNLKVGDFICVYDIPNEIANQKIGEGFYYCDTGIIQDYNLYNVKEYAIENEFLKINNLKSVYKIKKYIDYEDYYIDSSLKGYLEKVSIKTNEKEKVL